MVLLAGLSPRAPTPPMELISAYPPPPGLMEREGPDTSASRAIAARATAAVRANNDLLIDQLRRICRAANVETSIGDSAAELRLKLQARAPAKLVSTLQDSMRSPRPMFKLQPMPRAHECSPRAGMFVTQPVTTVTPALASARAAMEGTGRAQSAREPHKRSMERQRAPDGITLLG